MAEDQTTSEEEIAAGPAISESLDTPPVGQQAPEQRQDADGQGQEEEATGGASRPQQAPAVLQAAEVGGDRDALFDRLMRLQAEFDNYRKRVDRQQREMIDNAATGLVKKLLPVLDTADLALAHGGGEDVKQLASSLFDVLSKEGLERILPEGQAFDPEHHDAVVHEPAEGDDAPERLEVSEVLRAGYMWRGRILRPAMVKVRG